MDGLQYTLIGGGSQEQGIGLEFFLGLGCIWAMGVSWGFFSSTPSLWVFAIFLRLLTTYISCRDGVFRQTWAGFLGIARDLGFGVFGVASSDGFCCLWFAQDGWIGWCI